MTLMNYVSPFFNHMLDPVRVSKRWNAIDLCLANSTHTRPYPHPPLQISRILDLNPHDTTRSDSVSVLELHSDLDLVLD